MNPPLFLYTQEFGYRGNICVIAHNEATAREIMASHTPEYMANAPVEVQPCISGAVVETFGDR